MDGQEDQRLSGHAASVTAAGPYISSPLGAAFKGPACGSMKIEVRFFKVEKKKTERMNYSKYTYVLSCDYFPSFVVGK